MIITWSIINNEMSFIKNMVEWHLPWVDKMYILDTGSTDGTLEYLQSLTDPKLIIEKYRTSFVPEYYKDWKEMKRPFPEVEVRNYAISRCEEYFPVGTWLVQLDGDEIFMPILKEIINNLPSHITCLGHSTINPVETLKAHPLESRANITLYDPHVRIWKSGFGMRYMKNPAFKQQFHCIPVYNNQHLFHNPFTKFIPDIIHFHLHWMFGSKVEMFHKGLGKKEILERHKTNLFSKELPQLFWDARTNWIND